MVEQQRVSLAETKTDTKRGSEIDRTRERERVRERE